MAEQIAAIDRLRAKLHVLINTESRTLDELNAGRRRVAERYLEGMADLEGIELPRIANGRTHVWQMFTVLVLAADRTELLRKLRRTASNRHPKQDEK